MMPGQPAQVIKEEEGNLVEFPELPDAVIQQLLGNLMMVFSNLIPLLDKDKSIETRKISHNRLCE